MKFRVKDSAGILVIGTGKEKLRVGPGDTVDLPEDLGRANKYLEPAPTPKPSRTRTSNKED